MSKIETGTELAAATARNDHPCQKSIVPAERKMTVAEVMRMMTLAKAARAVSDISCSLAGAPQIPVEPLLHLVSALDCDP